MKVAFYMLLLVGFNFYGLFAQAQYDDTVFVDSCHFTPNCNSVNIDSFAGDAWQIGNPQKSFFDSAYYGSNAIMTDTLDLYDTNKTAFFQASFLNRSQIIALSFRQKYNFGSNGDGGYVAMSFDNGNRFVNVAFIDTLDFPGNESKKSGIYDKADTLASGIPAYQDSTGWKRAKIEWTNYYAVKRHDTIRVRFYFTSDTIKDNKDGWMIDNIKVSGYRYFGIEDKEDQVISVNPNPAKHYCRIHVQQSNVRTYEVRLFTLNGALVKQKTFSKNQGKLNLRNLENGVYMLRVQSGVDSWYKKLIKIE